MFPLNRPKVLITPLGRASAATLAFRSSGQLRVAAIVKATFICVPDQAVLLVDPAPIVEADQHRDGDPQKGVLVASDLVPYRPRTDVLLSGHARALAGRPARAMDVRLMVARGQELLLDKRLAVQGPHEMERGAGQPAVSTAIQQVDELAARASARGLGPPARVEVDPSLIRPAERSLPAGFDPIGGWSPARRALLRDPRVLDVPIPELPADFPWTYFHAAPEDQRIDFLQGDEWVGFEGMNVQLARVQSYLPRVRGAARVYGPGPQGRAGEAIALVADTLSIDADRLLVSVVWRGSFAVPSEVDLGGLHVVAGVEMAGVPLEFPASVGRLPASARELLHVADGARHEDGTATLAAIVAPAAMSRASDVLPFKRAASAPRVPPPAIPLPPVTPFERHAQVGAQLSRTWTPPAGVPSSSAWNPPTAGASATIPNAREPSTPIPPAGDLSTWTPPAPVTPTPTPPAQAPAMLPSQPHRAEAYGDLPAAQAPSTSAPSAVEPPRRDALAAPGGEPEAPVTLGRHFLAAMDPPERREPGT